MQAVHQLLGIAQGTRHQLDGVYGLIHLLVSLPGPADGLLGRQRGLGRVARDLCHRRGHLGGGGRHQVHLTKAPGHPGVHLGDDVGRGGGAAGQHLAGAAHRQQQAFQVFEEVVQIPRQRPQLVAGLPVDPHRQVVLLHQPLESLVQRREAQVQIPHHPPADEGGQSHAQQDPDGSPPEVAGTLGPHLINPLGQLLIEAILTLFEQAYLVGTQGKPGFGIHPETTAGRLVERQFLHGGHLGYHGRGQAVGQQLALGGARHCLEAFKIGILGRQQRDELLQQRWCEAVSAEHVA